MPSIGLLPFFNLKQIIIHYGKESKDRDKGPNIQRT